MNTENKIAEQAAEIDRLHLVLAERQAKIGELMGEAARAEIAGAAVQTPVGNPRDWLIEGCLIYRLSDDGINCDEINVTMAHGSRSAAGREAYAAGLLCLICESDSRSAAPLAPLPELTGPSEALPEEWRVKLKSIADWMDSSAQQQQIGPEEFSYASSFDYELAQAASELSAIAGAVPAQQQEPSLKDSLAEALHYPGCWDTAAYPALSDALSAVYDHFKCSECAAPGAGIGDAEPASTDCQYCYGLGEVQGQGSYADFEPPINKCSQCDGTGKA